MGKCVVVVPCYNEAERLDLYQFQLLVRQDLPNRVVFVNDGSTDTTLSVLQELRDMDPNRFEILNLETNVGKAEAVRRGLLHAFRLNTEYVGFWDADLATPLKVIPEFCEILDKKPMVQMVFGARVRLLGREIDRQAIRHYAGRLFATIVSLMLRLPVYDTQCGAKMFRVNGQNQILFQQPFRSRWIFDVEIIARLITERRDGESTSVSQSIVEFPLYEWRDVKGSKLKWWHMAAALKDLFYIHWHYFRFGHRVALSPAKNRA